MALKRKWSRLISRDTHGGWVVVTVGFYLLYRYTETQCSPFVACGDPARLLAFAFVFLGSILVVLRALVPKEPPSDQVPPTDDSSS